MSRGHEWLRRTAAATLAGVLLALGAAVTTASPAAASISPAGSNCDDAVGYSGWGMLCVYNDADYDTTGTVWNWFDLLYILDEECLDTGNGQTNTISSFSMNPTPNGQATFAGSWKLRFYPNDNCQGTPVMSWPAAQHNWDNNLTTTAWGNRNDTINSIAINTYP